MKPEKPPLTPLTPQQQAIIAKTKRNVLRLAWETTASSHACCPPTPTAAPPATTAARHNYRATAPHRPANAPQGNSSPLRGAAKAPRTG